MTPEMREVVLQLARDAGAAIMKVYVQDLAVEHKDDRSPLTAADMASHHLIVAGLEALTPDVPVLSEESKDVPWEVRSTWRRYWLVDPLDGTREFVKKNGEFTVNIALIDHGQPVLGVVLAPAVPGPGGAAGGCLYAGIVGQGAWKREAGVERPISVRLPPPQGLSVVASRHYADDPRLTPFLEGRRVADVVHMGSALKFCLVAEGKADLYPRFGPTMEWDTAAPQAVVEAAGGSVRLLEGGTPLRYGKPDWRNPPFVCVGRE